MCLWTKFTCQPPSGELHPLPIPDMPWDTASVDFIVELPESNGKDAIMVVVDSITKRSHFVSMVTTLTATRTTQHYLQHVWKHHRLPRRVVSDRGPNLWRNLQRNCIDSSELSWLPLPHTIPKEMGRWNESIRNWNNTFSFLLTKDKMIGTISFPLLLGDKHVSLVQLYLGLVLFLGCTLSMQSSITAHISYIFSSSLRLSKNPQLS